jgi:ATP phosphoribosyltransferase regulatory subunit
LRDKDMPAVQELTGALPEPARAGLRALAGLYGPAGPTLAAARSTLPPLPEIGDALDALQSLAAVAQVAAMHVDLADLRGYHYYTGATFSVFAEGSDGSVQDCGRGGRYDGVGHAFGRARPATGFSLDLRRLAAHAGVAREREVIAAPADAEAALTRTIAALRARGESVVVALPDEAHHGARRLVRRGDDWVVEEL